MMLVRLVLAVCLFALSGGVHAQPEAAGDGDQAAPPEACDLDSGLAGVVGTRLQYRSFPSEAQTGAPVLVIALHGDAPRNNPSYQYLFAQRVAAGSENTIAVGLLRPGYTDRDGRVSDGRRGRTTGRNYNAWRIEAIARSIEALRDHYGPRRIILAGHSGGSAISAKLIALYPG